jgi:hypothetical protein
VWYLRGVVDDLLRYGDSTSTNRVPAEAGGLPEPAKADGPAGLTLRGVAAALGLSVSAVRGHVRVDRLAASQVQGKRGPEYRVCPAVVTAFAAERSELGPAARGNGSQEIAGASAPSAAPSPSDDVRELQERLKAVTDEVARCKALGAAAAEHYRDELTRLQDERDAALVQANAVTAELEHLRRRGLLGRLFGG